MKPRMTIALKKSILYTVYHLTSRGWNFHSVFISFREQTTTLIAFRFLLHLCVEQWQSQQSSNWNHSQQSIWKSRSINYEFYVRQSREWWRCYSRNKIISINIVTLHTVSRHDTRHTATFQAWLAVLIHLHTVDGHSMLVHFVQTNFWKSCLYYDNIGTEETTPLRNDVILLPIML